MLNLETSSYINYRLKFIMNQIGLLNEEKSLLEKIYDNISYQSTAQVCKENMERQISSVNETDRRGLQAKGRTRVIFELIANQDNGGTPTKLAEVMKEAAKLKKVRTVCREAEKEGYFYQKNGRYFIADRGINLIEPSVPYKGESLLSKRIALAKEMKKRG